MEIRIKQIRLALALTQQKFAEAIGVRRNTVAQWEMGKNKVTDQSILSVCRAFNVNEKWLRTGDGEMFIDMSRDDEIADFIGRIAAENNDNFQIRFVSMLASLDEIDWLVIEKMALKLYNKKKRD